MAVISVAAIVTVLVIQTIVSFIGFTDLAMSGYKIICALIFAAVSSMILTSLPVHKASNFKMEEGLEMM